MRFSVLWTIAADEMCIGWSFVGRDLVDGDEKDGVSRINAFVRESLYQTAEFIGSRVTYVFGCWIRDEITVFHGCASVGMCDGCSVRGCGWAWE